RPHAGYSIRGIVQGERKTTAQVEPGRAPPMTAMTETERVVVPRGKDGRRPAVRKKLGKRQNGIAYLFMTPWLIGFLLLTAGPLLGSLALSFTNFNLLEAPTFVGLDNYVRMFTEDPRFWQSLKVTLIYVVLTVPLQLAFGLFVAIILNQKLKGIGLYRSVYYIPSLLGGSVAIAVIWSEIFEGDGVVNTILRLFGIEGISWISNPDTALYTLVLLNIWQFGSPMVIFLAALKNVPEELYDAASVDGAGRWQKFRNVTLPMITPIVLFNVVLQTIQAFQAFTPAYVVSGGTGGPSDSTLFYTLYLYIEGFKNLHMGYAS